MCFTIIKSWQKLNNHNDDLNSHIVSSKRTDFCHCSCVTGRRWCLPSLTPLTEATLSVLKLVYCLPLLQRSVLMISSWEPGAESGASLWKILIRSCSSNSPNCSVRLIPSAVYVLPVNASPTKKWHRILGLDSKISFYFPLRFWSSRYLTIFVASQSLKNYYFPCKAVQQVKTPAVLMTWIQPLGLTW